MARILVTSGPGLGARALASRLAASLQEEGHDGFTLGTTPETALDAVRDSDAVVALLELDAAGAVACAAFAHALGKPTLALHTQPLDAPVAAVFAFTQPVSSEEEAEAAVQSFVADVKPFAGRLVRDLVPQLVREAGHAVQFREATSDERPRYLKRKVSEEARELESAGPGAEKEEIADLLEALEALLLARGYSRDDLKAVKQAKHRRRGGFERGFIVESAAQGGSGGAAPTTAGLSASTAPMQNAMQPPAQPVPESGQEVPFELPNPFAAMDIPVEETPEPVAQPWPSLDGPIPVTASLPEQTGPEASPFLFRPMTTPTPPTSTPPTSTSPSTPTMAQEFRGWPSLQGVLTQSAAHEPRQTPLPSGNGHEVEFRPEPPGPRRTDLWNLGKGGTREPIKAKVEDPDQVEPKLREI